jgi:SAM-dependent methyltransferase
MGRDTQTSISTAPEKVLTAEFLDVTEIEGQRISREQLERICHRYHWAAGQCHGLDVLEVACGAGQGLATLKRAAGSLVAGDYSPEVLENARNIAGDVPLYTFKAEAIPFGPNSFDRILLFEALYYVNAQAFFTEARRLLRKGGAVLIATANKDLYDFTHSPFTTRYLGAKELSSELREAEFDVELFGYLDTAKVGFRQRLLRPAKALASRLGLIPKTLRGRERLKKFFFGSMIEMPATLEGIAFDYEPPCVISGDAPDRRHKVLYCRAVLSQKGRIEE